MADTKVISLGGSIVAPEWIDTGFVKRFKEAVTRWLDEKEDRRIILVTGGGALARNYQKALRQINDHSPDIELDWIGIYATRVNARLIKAVFEKRCSDDIVIDPSSPIKFTGSILVAAGWKPGFSTDYDAVLLAETFEADTVINLSNIKKVYTADPKVDPAAQPLDHLSWKQFADIVGSTWKPGINAPFDPVASKKAAELGLRVAVAAGRDLHNLAKILDDQAFEGTLIGPK